MRSFLSIALLLAAPACGFGMDNASGGSVTPEPTPAGEPQTWLDTQNAVRHGAKPTPAPPLADFTWSSAAATVAQDWANGCTYQHNAGRGNRGENIAANAPPGTWTIADAVGAWAGEASFYDYTTNSCAAGHECGHYTQIVWRDGARVGCAHRTCTVNSPFAQNPSWDFWVCDYEPPGNVVGQRPY